jgi:DNA-binding PadR family transcriptional regulator
MAKRGRNPEIERARAVSRITQALEDNPDGLGVRELRRESGIGSFETLYKYLNGLLETGAVVFREVKVGRGKLKKIFTLSKKGIAQTLEFRILDYFERVRESCMENERFEIDNYGFCYAIYGMPKNLNKEEEEQAGIILKRIDSALLELDDLRELAINKEARKYHSARAKVHAKISQYVSKQNKNRKPVVIDAELRKELDSCIPSTVKNKMRLDEKEDFALIITRGPSFIDEYSLRPENYLLNLVQGVENWNDEGIESVIEQLARNKHVDAEAIEKLKQWDAEGKISGYYWQEIKKRLKGIPKKQEEMKKEKDLFIQSGGFKEVLGLRDENSFVVTKKMIGKRKLDELRKELSAMASPRMSSDRSRTMKKA